jgi:RNA recognition motif-containing protein
MPKLFLGNIPHAATESDISDWIQSYGFVVQTVEIITDRNTGSPRGFCFATLADQTDAEAAVKKMNGTIMRGRPITVNHAVPLNLNGSNQRRRTA